ncbi:hypothetical protein cypCar_00038464 [Cyprinus carpio]|nr:hypothetical protein cypCar_00038464 [Cyprinus carpio]
MSFFKQLFEQQNNDNGFKPAPSVTGYFGTVKPDPNFNAQNDAAKLKKAIETKVYGELLEENIKSDVKGDLETTLLTLCKATRSEDSNIDDAAAKSEAKALFEAGENRIGTVCSVLIDILTNRSEAQLYKIFQYYGQLSKDSLAKDLEVKGALNKPAYFAERLHLAMKGLGTNTDTLTRIIVSRSEIDLLKILQEYKRMYGKSLQEDILKETSGDYEKIMMTLCGTP